MEKRQTTLVESVGLLFQTRVQFPPSPQYEKSLLIWGDFLYMVLGIEQSKPRLVARSILRNSQQRITEGNSRHTVTEYLNSLNVKLFLCLKY